MARPVARRGEGRERVIAAAAELFFEHGVTGTSLQMIAKALGVTKASVYFQFHSKEEILAAVLEPALADFAALVEAVEARPTLADQRRHLLAGLVDLVVEHRRIVAILSGDPSAKQLLGTHAASAEIVARVTRVLLGPDPGPSIQVSAAVFGAGLMTSCHEGALLEMDDVTLRRELLRCSQALFAGTEAAED